MNILATLTLIDARAERATAGPWKSGAAGNSRVYGADGEYACAGLVAVVYGGPENRHFISHARSDIPRLSAALRVAVEALHEISCEVYAPHAIDKAAAALTKITELMGEVGR